MQKKFQLSLIFVFCISLCGFNESPVHAEPSPSPSPAPTETQKVYNEVQGSFGFVPGFVRAFPEQGLPAAWDEMKELFFNPSTHLSGQVKDLIGVAVDVQIPCQHCLYMDREFAKLDGTSDAQINEAIALAGLVRQWSTMINGLQPTQAEFDKDMAQISAHVKKMKAKPAAASAEKISPPKTLEEAFQDMRVTLGSVPSFIQKFPKLGLVPAWNKMKALLFNPHTSIPPKEKDLISLGVSAQIPCQYCVTFHKTAARLNGATDEEISEAIGVAGLARNWSAVIQGTGVDLEKFKQETQQMVQHIKSQTQQGEKPKQ